MTFVVKRPDGVEYKRTQIEDQGAGGRSYALPLLSDASTGTWHISVYADPKQQAIGEASFLVEDYVPERLDFTVTAQADAVRANEPGRDRGADAVSLWSAWRQSRNFGRSPGSCDGYVGTGSLERL